MNAYSAAANVAEEVLSGIRTVFAFRGEKKEINRYNNRLIIAKKAGARKGLLSGIEDGVVRFLFFGINALGFWYGVQLVLDDRDKIDKEYTPAVLMIVRSLFLFDHFCFHSQAKFTCFPFHTDFLRFDLRRGQFGESSPVHGDIRGGPCIGFDRVSSD